MPVYNYEAVKKDGETYKGTFEAPSKTELYAHVRDEGGRLISAKEKGGTVDLKNLSIPFLNGVKTHDKIIFARNLGAMINAGLSVTRALTVMEKQAKNKALKELFSGLIGDVTKGDPLSTSMARHPKIFSPLFVSMVKAGEESGNLSNSLKIVADQMDKSYQLTKKVHGALIYPSVILSVMIVIAILMLIYMVPTLTATFKDVGATLPLSTRIIIAVSGFMIDHTLIVLAGLILLVGGFMYLFRSTFGQRIMDIITLHLPVIGNLVREINSARTARTLSSLLSSGVDIVVALEVTRDVLQNHLYKEVVEHIRTVIQKGETMSSVLNANEKLYPAFVGEMAAVGEETGKIAEMLLGVADYYEDDVDEKTKDLSTIIEPVLMIIIGTGVGIFAVSMLAPTYSLVNNI